MGKNDPFFLNASRLKTAHSYYHEIGRKPSVLEELAKLRERNFPSTDKLRKRSCGVSHLSLDLNTSFSSQRIYDDNCNCRSQLDIDFEKHSSSMTGILRMIFTRIYNYMKSVVTGESMNSYNLQSNNNDDFFTQI